MNEGVCFLDWMLVYLDTNDTKVAVGSAQILCSKNGIIFIHNRIVSAHNANTSRPL